MKDIQQEQSKLCNAVEQALEKAKQLGASAAEVAITKTEGINIACRMGELETVEFNRDGALGITVYKQGKKGSASTADLSEEALDMAISKAIDIANYTSEDDCAGLADKELMEFSPPDLALYHPDDKTPEQMIEVAKTCEQAALEFDQRIENSDGASYASYTGVRAYGNSHGLVAAYPSSRHSLSCGVIAAQGEEMQRDFDYSVSRKPDELTAATEIGVKSAQNAVSRLGSQKLDTRKAPILFHREIASGLLGHFVAAISGGNIYRRSSFLLDYEGKSVFPNGFNIKELPHIESGLASSPFDSEGVKTHDMDIVVDGRLESYLTTSYSARKLGRKSNGHAGGIHNWLVEYGDASFEQLLKQMDTGLLVTELMGQGVNIITGDYSRGAAGFWVENGQIQYPVHEITIAGNLKEMLANIVQVGNDRDLRGSIQTGSILLDELQIAGS